MPGKEKPKLGESKLPMLVSFAELPNSQCSGEHPTCSRCHERGFECEYDVLEGLTKRQQLQYDLDDRGRKLEHAMGILDHLQSGSDHEAAESLARLRTGSSIEDEYRRIQAFSPRSSTQRTTSSEELQRSIDKPDKAGADYLATLAPGMQNFMYTQAWDARSWNSRGGGGMSAPTPDNIDPQMLAESNNTTSYN
ncbi:hypothetical protein CB0940_08821 [Cercospora beticola]|uniref:Zn(2)-C6 fungal-type domain-containing protein n=1 Tax=Cercospora beticola TaxID=122368 RepID=A0A2G5HQA2_CERBT|nr:hypothetical protein CB0940_08821 [Cercospora beticola]PIA94709.1 hypothetical protein CB0940_08821 [Cercospora beticola]